MSPDLFIPTGLLVGVALGFVLQRGRFCVTGAFRNVWTARDTRWMTAYLIAIAVLSVGFFTLLSFGFVHNSDDALTPAATVVGSLIFGVGIILAGGCATGTYYRAGEGLIGSWLALITYAASASAMKNGSLAGVNDGLKATNTTEVTTFHGLLGVSPWLLVFPFVALVCYLTWRQLQASRGLKVASLPPQRTGLAHWLLEKPWHPFVSAVLVGIIGTITYPLSYAAGRESGMGITTPSSDLAYGITADPTKLWNWGVLFVVGIILGSYIAAKASGEFRLRVPDARTLVRALAGGVFMGVGASWAGGCTIGGSLVGSAEMSANGWLSFAGFFVGAGIGAKLFLRTRTVTLTPTVKAA